MAVVLLGDGLRARLCAQKMILQGLFSAGLADVFATFATAKRRNLVLETADYGVSQLDLFRLLSAHTGMAARQALASGTCLIFEIGDQSRDLERDVAGG